VTAYNRADINAMLDCYDPTTSKGVKAAMNIAGDLLGVDAQDVLNLMPFLYNSFGNVDMGGTTLNDAKPTISMAVLSSGINGDTADVSVHITLTAGGQSYEQDANIPMIRMGGRWYFSGAAQ
jgi:hypothetical protein